MMEYYMTFKQYDKENLPPKILTKVVPATDKLKFYLDMMENCKEAYELISIVPKFS